MDKITTFFKNYQFLADFLTCGFKACAADAITQHREIKVGRRQQISSNTNDHDSNNSSNYHYGESSSTKDSQKSEMFDWPRNLAFLLYGGLYQGDFQEIIFNHVYPRMFGDDHDFETVAPTVVFNNFVTSPLLCLPMAYILKGLVFRTPFKHSIERYVKDVKEKQLLFKYWGIWIPVDTLVFTVVPAYFRVTFIAIISFFWLMILSSIAGVRDEDEAQSRSTTFQRVRAGDEFTLMDPVTPHHEDSSNNFETHHPMEIGVVNNAKAGNKNDENHVDDEQRELV